MTDWKENRAEDAYPIMRKVNRKCTELVRGESTNSSSSRDFENLPEVLTARELEKLLKIDVKTIYGYVRLGLIPYVRIQSNVRFLKQEILDWIEEHSYRP